MPWRNDANWRFYVVMGWIAVVALFCAYGLKQVQDNANALRQQSVLVAHNICVTSNSARKSLYDLLVFAEQRTKQTDKAAHAPQKEVNRAVRFYDVAKSRIKFTRCPPPLP